MNQESNIPNAIAFKVLIEDTYQVCVCERKIDGWSEDDIVLLPESPKSKDLYDALHDTNFHVIFLNIEYIDDSLAVSYENSTFLYQAKLASDMYSTGEFFNVVEEGYQQNYQQNE